MSKKSAKKNNLSSFYSRLYSPLNNRNGDYRLDNDAPIIIRCNLKKCYFISNLKKPKNKFARFKKMLYLCGRFAKN
jgi:hypothetical protein